MPLDVRQTGTGSAYPPTSDPGAPLCLQRRVPDSIATPRLELAAALDVRLDRRPCCVPTRKFPFNIVISFPGNTDIDSSESCGKRPNRSSMGTY